MILLGIGIVVGFLIGCAFIIYKIASTIWRTL